MNELRQASAANQVNEYEVYSPVLEPTIQPIICRTAEEAEQTRASLVATCGKHFGASCGWRVREVVLNERPIPKWSVRPTAITVEEGRRLAAAHGQDRMVILGWNAVDKGINIVTVGSSSEHSEAASTLGKFVARAIGYDLSDELEDRRSEHETTVPVPAAE